MSAVDVDVVDEIQAGDIVTITGSVHSVHRSPGGELDWVTVAPLDTEDKPRPEDGFRLNAETLAYAPSIRRPATPLPTELGTRFWGKSRGTHPQWWFIIATPEFIGREGISYASVGGLIWTDDMAEMHALAVLPDPEVAR